LYTRLHSASHRTERRIMPRCRTRCVPDESRHVFAPCNRPTPRHHSYRVVGIDIKDRAGPRMTATSTPCCSPAHQAMNIEGAVSCCGSEATVTRNRLLTGTLVSRRIRRQMRRRGGVSG